MKRIGAALCLVATAYALGVHVPVAFGWEYVTGPPMSGVST